jgi:hypothetical protein
MEGHVVLGGTSEGVASEEDNNSVDTGGPLASVTPVVDANEINTNNASNISDTTNNAIKTNNDNDASTIVAPATIQQPPVSRASRLHQVAMVREYPDEGAVHPLFDAFIVVGLPNNSANNTSTESEASVLFCFPESYAANNERTLQSASGFCCLEPLKPRTIARSYSNSALNRLIHGSDQAFSRRHVFCINNNDGSFTWGVCLVKEELLSMPASFLSASLLTVAEAASDQHRAADRVEY